MARERPTVTLGDGNVFAIIGACSRAARQAGWATDDVSALMREFESCESYDAVLGIVVQRFDVELAP